MRLEIVFLVVCVAGTYAADQGFTATASGVDPGAPDSYVGNIVDVKANEHARVADKEQRQSDMPFMCLLEGKSCGTANSVEKTFPEWNPNSASFDMDCMRACRNPCLGDKDEFSCDKICNAAEVVGGKCFLVYATASPDGGSTPGACDKSDAPGGKLYVAPPPDSDPENPSCPEGVPAPGFPEDKVSKAFCKLDGKECAGPDAVDVEVYFEASERLCKATCTTRTYCNAAYYSPVRRCHLRRFNCARLPNGDLDPAHLVDTAGASTLIRLTKKEFSSSPRCPPGTVLYQPPPELYTDLFCEYPGKKCNIGSDDDQSGDMYYQDDSPERGYRKNAVLDCPKKCAGNFGCGSVWSFPDPEKSGKVRCVLQRIPDRCPVDQIVGAHDSTLFLRIKKSDPAESGFTEGDLTDLDKKNTVCGKISGGSTPWKESYCGFMNMQCDNGESIATVATKDFQVCLTACRNQAGCQGANVDTTGCHLQANKCWENDDNSRVAMNVKAGGVYMRKKAEGDAPCPFPDTVCANKWKHAAVSKAVSPPVFECDQMQGEAGESSGCTRSCNSPAGSGCSAAGDGCVCKGNYLFNAKWGRCVPPSVCPCYDGNDTPRLTQTGWLSDDCSQSKMCDASLDAGGAPSVRNDGDHACHDDDLCTEANGEGFCACAYGFYLKDGECAEVEVPVVAEEPPPT